MNAFSGHDVASARSADAHDHPACWAVERLLTECDLRFLRRSGPGGQRRNKVETAVVVSHRPTGIAAEAGERRRQAENRAVAILRLRIRLALEVRSQVALPGRPSAQWSARCLCGQLKINPAHEEFPALLAEALDALAACQFDVAKASSFLACSATQLGNLLKLEPRAWSRLNEERGRLGLKSLR